MRWRFCVKAAEGIWISRRGLASRHRSLGVAQHHVDPRHNFGVADGCGLAVVHARVKRLQHPLAIGIRHQRQDENGESTTQSTIELHIQRTTHDDDERRFLMHSFQRLDAECFDHDQRARPSSPPVQLTPDPPATTPSIHPKQMSHFEGILSDQH